MLIAKYKDELKNKFQVEADMALLKNVTIGLGPSIYNADSSTVSNSDEKELATVKNKFLIGKLGLEDGPELDDAIAEVMERYGRTNRSKYRAVVYYMLVTYFHKEALYQ